MRELLQSFGADLRYVFRHLPLADVHPNAQMAAEASEAAAAQGGFWEMHDALFDHQDALAPPALRRYALELGLDVERFWDDVRTREHAPRVAEDVRSADESGVAGTPTWESLAPATFGPPSARRGQSAIYDPVRDRMIIFGGVGLSGTTGGIFNDMWTLSLADPPG